jgi:hypothetical protein
MLWDEDSRRAVIDADLVKKAQSSSGHRERQHILWAMDPVLRVQAMEVAQRKVNPQKLYEVGRDAVSEAIKLYRIEQPENFQKFAKTFIRQAMLLARDNHSTQPQVPKPE